ncbi:gametocyte-specific factor 1-like [Eublepharis macularius]|uniref:Gametocyte-specific factor 1-like n=1 Tax=Eublepharis macularius TaxID=481883 RepID=A0AA97LKD6_EUBMA|nr:gametocyte-specific factor 1-like [Eublepharis macularius]XP_054859684.1 gametocyte-specific factor 1-like [Eublepharis macularius]
MADSYVDAMDPDKLMQCPYDTHHKIRACRFPYHLVKCRKSHLDIAQQLVTCPFNARHQVPRTELSQHIASCDDRTFVEQDIASQLDNRKERNVVSTWQPPPCEEDWDKDLEDGTKSVFVWGTSHSESSGTTVEHKNRLPPGLRAPRSLPNVLPWKSSTEN